MAKPDSTLEILFDQLIELFFFQDFEDLADHFDEIVDAEFRDVKAALADSPGCEKLFAG